MYYSVTRYELHIITQKLQIIVPFYLQLLTDILCLAYDIECYDTQFTA